jgi:hypothetical protein
MTRQIEGAYRRNKRRSWLLIAAVAALAAAIAIPIASGTSGGGKYYTLGSDKSVCVGDSGVSVALTLTNKAQSQRLGSANITFPSYVTVTNTTKGTREGNVVKLRSLNLQKNASLTFSVTINVDNVGSSAIQAKVKQSNEFNDDDGEANLFQLLSGTSLPKLTAEECYGTIEGKVWQDTNENGTIDGDPVETGQGTFRVYLYEKTGTSTYAYRQDVGTSYNGTTGAYKFDNVRLNRAYVLCEQPPLATSWSQTTPLVATSPCGTSNSTIANGLPLAFTANVTGQNFGNVPAVALSENQACGTSPFGGGTTNITPGFEYEAKLTLPSGTCKSGSLVMFTYQNASQRVATLHPPGDPVNHLKYPVVERIKWTGLGTVQRPFKLSYDDIPPYGDHLQEMPMCLSDPRPNPGSAPFALGSNPDSVLPGDHTSCMIVSAEYAGGTYEAFVYSKVDGFRAGG